MIALCAITQQTQAQKVVTWPFGEGTFVTSTDSLTSAITVNNSLYWVDYGTLDTTMTITVTATPGLKKGAQLFIKAASNTTARTVNFSTGFKGVAMTGVISKTKVAHFIYNGVYFYYLSSQQVD